MNRIEEGNQMYLQVHMFESLPTITFRNKGMKEVHTWVCESARGARDQLRRLKAMAHIEIIHVGDASVKFDNV